MFVLSDFSHYAMQMLGGKMAKSSEERAAADRDRSFRKQDAQFCARLQAAIERGRESCPVGVSREPGTKRPVEADRWKKA